MAFQKPKPMSEAAPAAPGGALAAPSRRPRARGELPGLALCQSLIPGLWSSSLLPNRDHSVVFEIAFKYCISDSLVDYDGYDRKERLYIVTLLI